MKKSLGAQTILFPTPVLIIGTYDKSNQANVAAVAWGGICCSRPPCVAVSLRAATYSHQNIKERMAFTVNIPSEKYLKQADYFGIASGKKEDKFRTSGLTPVKSDCVDAPYVKEFPLILECTVKDIVEIGLHTLFVGEVKDVKADESVLNKDGVPDVKKIEPFMYDPANQLYYGTGKCLGEAFSVGEELK